VELHKGTLYLDKPEDNMNVFIMTIPYLASADKKKTITGINTQTIDS
jgi:hypothetical protein